MARYGLDSLGWYNFEWLIQTWLKSEYGFAVESWGTHRDRGRDAYSERDLIDQQGIVRFVGPVIIQAKFVQNANAAGSNFRQALSVACKAEVKHIAERVERGLWDQPETYILATNCPLNADDRSVINEIFDRVCSGLIVSWGEGDIADALDLHPDVARAFPQILSYRNLILAIDAAQKKGVKERSSAALQGAESILPVFVPTAAYERSWTVARKHSFVVLSGPPEMGKTSIGWMIAMAQMSNGWEIIECREPQDVFDFYDSEAKQLFLADDAFGRTEFKPAKGELWEADLAKVLQRVDTNHWLVWTSRKHILERAVREMDLTGKASKYPKPAEVLVKADELSAKEKALILYRHAVHAGLESDAKSILRANLGSIVNDPHFTPERIRRFVVDVLPKLAARVKAGTLKKDEVAVEVENAIEKYTEMMEKSFEKLSTEQQWVLVSFLDEENVQNVAQLQRKFTRLYPGNLEISIERLLHELDESFLRSRNIGSYQLRHLPDFPQRLDWVHPSYRDLVIEKLSLNRSMRLRYLEKGGLAALTLALSQGGGAAGEREFPLLPDAESWSLLTSVSVSLIEQEGGASVEELLSALEGVSLSDEANAEPFAKLVECVCKAATNLWDCNNVEIDSTILRQFYKVSSTAKSQVASPQLEASWQKSLASLQSALETARGSDILIDAEDVQEWAELAGTIRENEPRFLRKADFPDAFDPIINELAAQCEMEARTLSDFDSSEEALAETERVRALAAAAKALAQAIPERAAEFQHLELLLDAHAAKVEAEHDRLREEEMDKHRVEPEDENQSSGGAEVLNLSELFSDL